MSLLDRLRGLFLREKCERAISYDKKTIEIKSKIGMPGVPFSLANFKTEVQKIREASEFAEALDDYQYQMCKICKVLAKNDPEWKKYNKLTTNQPPIFRNVIIQFYHFDQRNLSSLS